MKADEKQGPFPLLKGKIPVKANCCHPSVRPHASRVCVGILVRAPLTLAITYANWRILTAMERGKC